MTIVYISKTDQGIESAIHEIFSRIENTNGTILKASKEVYIKVNGVHCKDHCYTNPEVLTAVIKYLYHIGAKKVYVMEDSTIGNVTRLVFALTGYKKICEDTGAQPIYLDEEKAEIVQINKELSFELPRTIMKIVREREAITYINLPKLKTHNATVVTLGLKNQFGFLSHKDRKIYHDNNLHAHVVELYEYIKADITLIDAIEGISGEIPLSSFENQLVKRYNLLIGGNDGLAVDVVGAKLLGYDIEDVPHLKLAAERSLGEGKIEHIHCVGASLKNYHERIDWNIINEFPGNVRVVRGKRKICREGCEINTLIAVQMLAYDYGGKGDFFVMMGEGFEPHVIEQLKEDGYCRGLLAGSCAINELGEKFIQEFGKKNVFTSHDCCNISETVSSLIKLTGLSTFDLLPTTMPKALGHIISAKLHGSRALLADLF